MSRLVISVLLCAELTGRLVNNAPMAAAPSAPAVAPMPIPKALTVGSTSLPVAGSLAADGADPLYDCNLFRLDPY